MMPDWPLIFLMVLSLLAATVVALRGICLWMHGSIRHRSVLGYLLSALIIWLCGLAVVLWLAGVIL